MELTAEDYKKKIENMYDMFCMGIECKDDKDDDFIGDVMPMEQWLHQVKSGGFIDYDGFGHLACRRGDGKLIVGKQTIKPSDVTKYRINFPEWASLVVWYNR